jgi:hypothetical protein
MTDKITIERQTLQAALEWMESAWHRIDGEWGPSGKTLDQECSDGDEPEIAALRAALAAQPADCGNTPYDEGPFTLAQPADLASKYEELRALIDGGSESMTHADAVEVLREWAEKSWEPWKPAAPPAPAALTDEQIRDIWFAETDDDEIWPTVIAFARAVLAAGDKP